MEKIADRLKALREGEKMNQTEFAAKFGLKQAIYSHYETGRCEPSLDVLCHIADVLGVSTDWLLGRASIPTTPDRLAQISSDLDDAAAANDAADRDSAG